MYVVERLPASVFTVSVRMWRSVSRSPFSSACTMRVSRSSGGFADSRRSRICASMISANSGKPPPTPTPRSVALVSGHVLCSSSWHQCATSACCSRGMPSASADTATGSTVQRPTIRSPPPLATIGASSSSVSSRVNGSTSSAVRGVNARCNNRRTRGCSGGSISPRKLSSSGTTTPAPRKPSADENRFASLNVAEVSAYVDV